MQKLRRKKINSWRFVVIASVLFVVAAVAAETPELKILLKDTEGVTLVLTNTTSRSIFLSGYSSNRDFVYKVDVQKGSEWKDRSSSWRGGDVVGLKSNEGKEFKVSLFPEEGEKPGAPITIRVSLNYGYSEDKIDKLLRTESIDTIFYLRSNNDEKQIEGARRVKASEEALISEPCPICKGKLVSIDDVVVDESKPVKNLAIKPREHRPFGGSPFGPGSVICSSCWYAYSSRFEHWEMASEDANAFQISLSSRMVQLPIDKSAINSSIIYDQTLKDGLISESVGFWYANSSGLKEDLKRYCDENDLSLTVYTNRLPRIHVGIKNTPRPFSKKQ